MSRWFRHYAGMMRDDKLVRVALKSKQSIERVLWIWGAILESAAEIDDGGRYDVDSAEVAYFLRADEGDVAAILDALAHAGRVADDRVVHWSHRQFQSDRSAQRVAAHRERKRAERSDCNAETVPGNDGVTLQERHCNSPETETETETNTEKEKNPPTPQGGKARDYAFSGKVARINRRDYEGFRRRFHAIPDFDAALAACDSWLSGQPEAKQRNWFGSVAPWLEKRHQEAVARANPRREAQFSGPC